MTTNTPRLDGFLTIQELATRLDVEPSTIHRWVRTGRIPSVKLGKLVLIPESALRRQLEEEARRGG